MTLRGKKGLMIEALKKHLGNVSLACKECQISRNTHYEWLKKFPIYEQEVTESEEFTLDWAENALKRLISDGNVAATIFFLKTKAKKRGYIEGPETAIQINNMLKNPELILELTKELK